MFFKKGKINKYNKNISSFIVGFLIFLFIFTSFSFKIKPAYAQFVDPVAAAQREKSFWRDVVWNNLLILWQKGGSAAFQAAIRNALNTIAYDTATYLGSGGRGRKPLFVTESWGSYLENVADQAGGEFIEQLGRKWNFDLCEPDFDIKMRIGLGLYQQQRPRPPTCTWSEMKNNWEEELRRPDFLQRFQAVFNPAQSDLGVALTLQTEIIADQQAKKTKAQSELESKGGWLDLRNIAGKTETPPGEGEKQADAVRSTFSSNLTNFTGDALVDAANVFLNQLAITKFNDLMKKLTKGTGPASSPYSGDWGGLADYEASPISGDNESLRKLLEPSFDTRADYDILAILSSCNKMGGYAPTNGCVIDEGFRQAIEERKTVGEALSLGYLKDWPFGFRSVGVSAIEPVYNQGYPYRSMLILRKYRIIPVGWELAAEYIHSNQEKLKNATLAKMVACFDPNDSYFGFHEEWCEGLVDPNWVLKAPQNFCAKEGYGPEIVSDEIVDDGEGGKERMIIRNDNYCGDEQSCIKEKSDGSCEAYGYCAEERRTWNFSAASCDPKYNTCQTFRAADGKTISYLENTLDYSGCSAGSAGCKGYATPANYDFGSASISWTGANPIYFNKNIETCSRENEGCHEFIRTKAGLGTNLVVNSGFENDTVGDKASIASSGGTVKLNNWPLYLGGGGSNLQAEIANGAEGRSGNILRITMGGGNGGLYSYDHSSSAYSNVSVIPKGFIMEPGVAYTLSAYVYLKSGTSLKLGIGNNNTQFREAVLTRTGSWERLALSVNNDGNLAANEFYIYGYGAADFYIDNIQFEIGTGATAYKEYGAANVIYEKLAPAYLECQAANPPARCGGFANLCGASDVGCEFYTSVTDKISIPAKTTVTDYCPAECDGFDNYIQAATNFSGSQAEYFIPKSARTCPAAAAGCDEFTNLDEVTRGGEGREYYTYLRQCVKPTDAGANCVEFYTWEGSEESGYQLKVFNLKASGSEPAITSDDTSECGEAIYNLPATDLGYNSDCRQFYNKAGGISYHSYTKTISCSDNCHPYRRTADSEIYMAIPGEGKACAASQNGCREYSGNMGSNMRIVLNNDFEGGAQGWSGSISSEALTVGGHSLETTGNSTSKVVGASVGKGKSYVLSFIAKKKGTAAAEFSSISFVKDGDKQSFPISGGNLESEWKLYKFNLASLEREVDVEEKLEIVANSNFYIDDIRLTEIVARHYLIKDSWVTPASCNQDINSNPFPLYMLGCGQYQDRAKNTHYLRSFSQLCQESAVGCELMIDTHNSSQAGVYTSATDPAVSVPADSFAYAVYDKNKQCNRADKGCGLFGSPYKYGDEVVYGDVYLKNNPDRYTRILCDEESEGCAAWSSESGNSFFKDPGDMVCEWRQATGEIGWGWYQKKVKRCNGAGTVCLSDKNCAIGQTCVLETADTLCLTSELKTFGYGGEGQTIYQPDNGWVGICSAAQAGCSEYIDPISRPAASANYKNDNQVNLELSTLYILKGIGAETNSINCSKATLRELKSDNSLGNPVNSISVSGTDSIIFFNDSLGGSSGGNICESAGEFNLRKAIAEYRLNQELDKTSCNGLVDFERGCVLFNERIQEGGSGLAGLKFDANLTIDDGNGVPPESGSDNNANALIKVSPNRVCAEWLACRSYVKDKDNNNICFDVGLCNAFDDSGNCGNFIASTKAPQIFKSGDDPGIIANLTGYSKFGYDGGQLGNNYYPIGGMEQVGDIISLSNGGFEMSGGNGYPVGWSNTSGSTWNDSMFKVITNAAEAKAALGFSPPEGRNILKMSSGNSITSEEIDFEAKTYIISAYVNTMNLSGGNVSISLPDGTRLEILPGNSRYFTKEFSLGAAIRRKITVSSGATGGVAYFDDIKIKPVLETKEDIYSRQSCRLYPKEDSLSCDYMDGSGVSQKGLTGYCLEYDRAPGSPDACLMWYPVDKVRGEGIEEGAGYQGKFPLYYCTDLTEGTKLKVKVVADDKVWIYIDGDGSNADWIAHGVKNGDLDEKITKKEYLAGKHAVVLYGYNGPKTGYVAASIESVNSAYMDPVVTSTDEKYGWRCAVEPVGYDRNPNTGKGIFTLGYEYNDQLAWVKPSKIGDVASIYGAEGIWPSDQYLERTTVVCRTIIDIKPVCEKFVQTVSAAGDNKVFQTRLSGGDSNFFVNTFAGVPGYTGGKAYYSSDAPPFGTIVYPNPAANPYEWDTRMDEGIQPLYYSENKKLPRMGQLHNDKDAIENNYGDTGELKRLFAQSYGGYKLVPEQTCLGGGVCSKSLTSDIVYSCASNSVNYAQDCSLTGCASGVKCSLNAELNMYTCNGLPNGLACCVPESSCTAEGKCENSNPQERASCDIRGIDTIANCNSTGEYKCDSTTSATPGSGDDCCYGGVCSNVCAEGVNAGKACEYSNPDCPIMKCSNNNLTCSGPQDPNCLKSKTCVGGERNIGADCSASDTICNGIDGTCSERRCSGGDNNNDVCDDPGDCPGGSCPAGTCSGGANNNGPCYGDGDCPSNDGVCTAAYWPCGISTTYGACITPQCVGGPRNGIACNLGGNSQGCVDPNDICVEVRRVQDATSNNNLRCCGPDTGTGTCRAETRDRYVCVGGSNAGVVCSEEEVGRTAEASAGRYIPDNTFPNWKSSDVCGKTISGEYINCTDPIVSHIKANGAETGETTIIKNGFANLTFNTAVNPNQLPLVRYEIDWGDGGTTVVSGVEMNHRPDEKNPHSVYHLYSYWDLRNKDKDGDGITCAADEEGNYCSVKPKITIKDNWGYGASGTFSGTVKVTEK
ncbi:MAG: hypothetical protein PHQ42_01645 [Patescibacteria group bacterium]|nr:hypothetical protein [Patescibacteria group bacterium]